MSKRNVARKAPSKYTIYKYAVVRVEDQDVSEKLFECIPELWFVDENKGSCYWPPPNGKAFHLRAISCEKPEDSWRIYECTVISDGHLTYNSGFKVVRDKCSQKYNTSSADEHITAASYRREHPVFALRHNEGNIEHFFTDRDETLKNESQKKRQNVKACLKQSSEKTSSSSSLLRDPSLISSSIALPSGTINPVVQKQNSHLTPDEPENDLDCGNGRETTASLSSVTPVAPQSTSTDTDIIAITQNHSSSQSPLSQVRSIQAGSDRSHSIGSRASSCGSKSSRSGSNVSRQSHSGSNKSHHSRLNRSLTNDRSSRSRTRRSPRSDSIADSGIRQRQKRNANKIKSNLSCSSGQNKSQMKITNNRFKKTVESTTNGSKGANVAKVSQRRRPRSRRSSSKSSRSRSRSLSRSARSRYDTTVHHRMNKKHRQSQSDSRDKKLSLNASFLQGKNRRRRSLEPISKRSRVSTHRSRSRSTHRRSSSLGSRSRSRYSSRSQQSNNNSRGRHLGNSHQRKNIDLQDGQQNREKQSRSTTESDLNANVTVKELMKVVLETRETINQVNLQLKDNDRRLHRMEVTVNKVFLLVGDLNGNGALQDELIEDPGFEIPNLPIDTTKRLLAMKRKLKNKEFRTFFLQQEKFFCCPTKQSTDTMTISKYLKRFISLRMRSKLTLKESVDDGTTLFKDFHEVYLYLIDVMKLGYRNANKTITFDEAHTALRIVWGRSKQLYRDARPKRN